MEKIIEIDGKKVGFKATALTPRIYRHRIGRDMVSDMASLRKAYEKAEKMPMDAPEEERTEAQLSVVNLEIFENAAWVMARQYDPNIKDSPDEWLDTFETFSIYEIMPHILELWALNNRTTAIPKKK
ncbi:hypothetical protein [Qiania dongpingensis]|uniref:Uncharacterized protein n=1 Tax=Qiania dongpingensis TaxID=2763669 RepID=A0A7G9G847_9FIRM|nr:hypothetical protein [Qiania dongpingensis]QNM06979.1 hypothetical protein H9Q78_05400 [Qiania dongpingensis]